MIPIEIPRMEDDLMGKQVKNTHFSEVEKQITLESIQTGYAVALIGEESTHIDGVTPVNLLEGSLTNQAEAQIGWILGRRQSSLERKVTRQGKAEELLGRPAATGAIDSAIRGPGGGQGHDLLDGNIARNGALRPSPGPKHRPLPSSGPGDQ